MLMIDNGIQSWLKHLYSCLSIRAKGGYVTSLPDFFVPAKVDSNMSVHRKWYVDGAAASNHEAKPHILGRLLA